MGPTGLGPTPGPLALRPCASHVDSPTRELRERLLDLVYQRQRSQEQLAATLEQAGGVRTPIEVKEEAAA